MNLYLTDYRLWVMVIINSAVVIIFAHSFTHPRTGRDWRSFGAFVGFVVALFTEMYGLPLTIFLLSGWLGNRYPEIDLFSHNSGHLWITLLGTKGNPHFSPLHLLSSALIFGGFFLLKSAWEVLYRAQRIHTLAVTGPYSRIRHPQYIAFALIMLGFLLQWPTFLTMLMFPVLVFMYVRLARHEEKRALADFGELYTQYAARTPALLPRLGVSGKRGR